MKNNLNWYVVLVITALVVYFTQTTYNYFVDLALYDTTYISYTILCLFVACTLFLGVAYHFLSDKMRKMAYDAADFMSSTVQMLGMVGTVIGMILAFHSFGEIDLSDVSNIKDALVAVSSGIGIALHTTLVGLACAISLKAQIFFLEWENET